MFSIINNITLNGFDCFFSHFHTFAQIRNVFFFFEMYVYITLHYEKLNFEISTSVFYRCAYFIPSFHIVDRKCHKCYHLMAIL